MRKGFTLTEILVAVAIFSVIATSVLQTYSIFLKAVVAGRWRIIAADITNSEFELLRNIPYQNIGLTNGIPLGVLAPTSTVVYDGNTFLITRTIRNIDDPYDGKLGDSPNDLSPADYKMAEVYIECPTCKKFLPTSIVGSISPKNLETASTNGALFLRVFDANGVPVPQASVRVERSNPSIIINDITDNQGLLAIVDAPPGNNAYRITATKSGFTTDRTYATSTVNPNPVKPDLTVLVQQVTQASFIIDKVSELNVSTIQSDCAIVPDVQFGMQGSKLIGTPNILKWSGNFQTDNVGRKLLSDLEWDTFQATISGTYYLAGSNPMLPLAILPDSKQNLDLVVTDEVPDHLLVTVKDASTQLPVSGATLTLTSGSFNRSTITGRGYVEQTDWSNPGAYSAQDGNMSVSSPIGEIKLLQSFGEYPLSGNLTSNIFDTGTSSNFATIQWSPTAQPPQTGNPSDSVKFQIASSPTNDGTETWLFTGPDGSESSYYTTSSNNIYSGHNGNRYFRYKIFLSTADPNYTPNIAEIAVTFTSSCIPPGQAMFSALIGGSYNIEASKTGYLTQVLPVNINSLWQSLEIDLMPQ